MTLSTSAASSSPGIDLDPRTIRLFRRLARSAAWRGRRRWGDRQPSIDPDHLILLWRRQAGRCAVIGLPFDDERFDGALVKHPYLASLDRIDPALPYLEGNMRLVCTAVNFGMGQWGDRVLRRIAESMLARPGTAAAETIWRAQKYEELGRLEMARSDADGAARAALSRRIAAVRRALTLGPKGLSEAGRRAARTRRDTNHGSDV